MQPIVLTRHVSTRHATGLVCVVWLACIGLAQAQRPAAPFTDVSTTHVPTAPDLHALDAVMIDVDADQDLDVVVAVENGPNALYRNNGTGHLRWIPGVFGTKAADNEHVRAADFNADGHMDVIFIAEDDEVHQLYFGDGRGGFSDQGKRLPKTSQANGLAVGDVNGDALPDIVVGNTSEGTATPARDFLWLNDAKRPGYFIDASSTHLPDTAAHTQAIALADLNADDHPDIVIASQSPPNRLLLNDGTGRFSDASDRLHSGAAMHSREVHVLDANQDGHPDLLFFNLTSNAQGWDKDPQTRLLINNGRGQFEDQSQRLPAHRFSSWGGTVIDFNGDGAPDILVSAIQVPGFVPMQVRAWRNDGNGHFTDATLDVMPSDTVSRGWSMAQGDLDGDRKNDVFIGGWRSQARMLLTNTAILAPRRPAATPTPVPAPATTSPAPPER